MKKKEKKRKNKLNTQTSRTLHAAACQHVDEGRLAGPCDGPTVSLAKFMKVPKMVQSLFVDCWALASAYLRHP
jgi:hypothetical protein